jgi:lipopolysaccharide cholinephosphotransferase
MCRLLPLKPFHKIATLKSAKTSQRVHTFVACTTKYAKGVYQRKWIEETVLMDFETGEFPVSAHYDDLLTTLYGDYMRIPKDNERKIKEHAILIDTEHDYHEYENYRDGMKFDVYTRNIH